MMNTSKYIMYHIQGSLPSSESFLTSNSKTHKRRFLSREHEWFIRHSFFSAKPTLSINWVTHAYQCREGWHRRKKTEKSQIFTSSWSQCYSRLTSKQSIYSSVTALDSQFSSILNSFKFPLYLNSSFADASWGSDRGALHQIKGRWLAHGLRTAHHVATALAPPPSCGRAWMKVARKTHSIRVQYVSNLQHVVSCLWFL